MGITSDNLIKMEKEKGAIRFGSLIYLLLAAGTVYIVIKIVPVYISYYQIKYAADVEAGRAHINNDEQIRKNLLEKARNLKINLRDEDIEIKRDEKEITINIGYVDDVILFNRYRLDFKFSFNVKKDIKRVF